MTLSASQLAGNQRRTLRKMREQLLRMADEWEGVDEFARSRLTELADEAAKVSADITPEAEP